LHALRTFKVPIEGLQSRLKVPVKRQSMISVESTRAAGVGQSLAASALENSGTRGPDELCRHG
jgi:hypothetical protein